VETTHRMRLGDARRLAGIGDESVDLAVTSPPYPMIEMWDGVFSREDEEIGRALGAGRGGESFERMHRVLDGAWEELYRVLSPGGFACINIGDATRTVRGRFALYPNHARVLTKCLAAGFMALPVILWRKQTNAPNKFMGSGMLPAGAYVTLEHETILILRKGGKREFRTAAEKLERMRSAMFWEERNAWFTDVWMDLKGTGQELERRDARKRSAAFPAELPYRLIQMFSVRGDTVLDPFLGLGTTTLAAMASMRNSIGVEKDRGVLEAAVERVGDAAREWGERRTRERLESHVAFVRRREREKGRESFKHRNRTYGFRVVTRQETRMVISRLSGVRRGPLDTMIATYDEKPPRRAGGKGAAAGEDPPTRLRQGYGGPAALPPPLPMKTPGLGRPR